jgi:hypothetical protein
MTQQDDTAQGLPDDGDPLLVRPYLQPGDPASGAAATWPAGTPTASQTPSPAASAADVTAVLPVAGGSRIRRPSRLTLGAAGAGAVVVALGAAGLVVLLKPDSHRAPQAFHDVSLPPWSTAASAPATPPATATEPGVPQPPAITGPAATTRATVTPTPSRRSSPAPAAAPGATSRAPSSPPPVSTVPAVPAVDRTGIITERAGVCLDLNGGVPVDSNHIQVFECNGTVAQVWTMAADGTLRVNGKCAYAGHDDAVRITTCGGQDTARWRVGPDRTLVNAATGQCLTDPASGRRNGSGVRTDDCDGGRNQQWELP